jgi:hypothetical protein
MLTRLETIPRTEVIRKVGIRRVVKRAVPLDPFLKLKITRRAEAT